jgi:multidrug efflux pump subunit AcrB
MKCFVYISDTTDWLTTKLLYKNAVDNTIQSMILCFIIILLATENWILALLTSFNIASIVMVIFGIIYAAGWGLNLFESILVVIIVGFSCDFSIHMADSYIEHEEAGRFEKVKASLGVTGVSIISGSLSTLLATAPMLAANIVFFSRFGQIMFITMALSTVFTLGPFSCILMMFGPQGHQGMISNFYGPLLRSAFENLEVKESVLRRQSMATHATEPGHGGKNVMMPVHHEEGGSNASSEKESSNPIHKAAAEEDGGPSEDRNRGQSSVEMSDAV